MLFAGTYGDAYYFAKDLLNRKNTSDDVETKTFKNFKGDILVPDTALQVYMGLLKAELEYNCVTEKTKNIFLKKVREEQEYLKSEEWLDGQAVDLVNKLKI